MLKIFSDVDMGRVEEEFDKFEKDNDVIDTQLSTCPYAPGGILSKVYFTIACTYKEKKKAR